MADSTPIITLMTDFGHEDIFVGVMKGVIARICPQAHVLDLTHAIPAFDVMQAAFRLRQAYAYFPEGTIHVVVVDPGVGSERRIVAMKSDGHLFLAPDNGVLSLVDQEKGREELVAVTEKRYFLPEVSASFHGRDIFAPVAAHLAAGTPLRELGAPLEKLHALKLPNPKVAADGSICGSVLWCDHFGNLITNVSTETIKRQGRGRPCAIQVGSERIEGLAKTYADVPDGALLAMIGSFGTLEIAVRLGSAVERLGANCGISVVVAFS